MNAIQFHMTTLLMCIMNGIGFFYPGTYIQIMIFKTEVDFFCMLFLNCWRRKEVWYQHKSHCRIVWAAGWENVAKQGGGLVWIRRSFHYIQLESSWMTCTGVVKVGPVQSMSNVFIRAQPYYRCNYGKNIYLYSVHPPKGPLGVPDPTLITSVWRIFAFYSCWEILIILPTGNSDIIVNQGVIQNKHGKRIKLVESTDFENNLKFPRSNFLYKQWILANLCIHTLLLDKCGRL